MASADREMLTRQIRDGVDIVDLIGSYISLRRAGSGFKGLCPFHEEKTPSFSVHPAKQTFHCFGCGVGGDVFSFIQLKENVSFVEARQILADRAGISLDKESSASSGGPGKSAIARANEWAQKVFRRNFLDSAGDSARQYAANRGISGQMVEAFGLGLAVDSYDSLIRQAAASKVDLKLLVAAGLIKQGQRGDYYDTFRHRLMFPIVDATNRITGFGGRALGDDPAKYLNSPATALFDKSRNVFGLNHARTAIGEKGRAIVVEGYTDCIMAHQFGFTETVATLGTAMTEDHARLLRRYGDRVILLFDSDEAGQRAADRALSVTLGAGLDVALARVPEGKDPCDYLLSAGATGLESVLNAAIGALQFKWRQVARQFEASATGPGRRRAVQAFLQELAGWLGRGAVDPIQTGLLLNQLSQILSLPAEDLHRQLRTMARASGHRVVASPARANPAWERTGSGRASNAQEAALRCIVEVLLNEPQHYPAVAPYVDPSAISEPALAAVTREMVDMFQSGEPFRIDELIGRFESPEFGGLITDLQVRGERRGGYSAVIEGAITCLQSFARSWKTARLADEIRQQRRQSGTDHGDNTTVPSGEDERLLALAENARNPHFSPNRARKRFLDASAMETGGPNDVCKQTPADSVDS